MTSIRTDVFQHHHPLHCSLSQINTDQAQGTPQESNPHLVPFSHEQDLEVSLQYRSLPQEARTIAKNLLKRVTQIDSFLTLRQSEWFQSLDQIAIESSEQSEIYHIVRRYVERGYCASQSRCNSEALFELQQQVYFEICAELHLKAYLMKNQLSQMSPIQPLRNK